MMKERTPESTLRARLINGRPHRAVMVEAADRIEELEAELKQLRLLVYSPDIGERR